MFSEHSRMDLEHDECFPNVFSILSMNERKAGGKSSVHSRSIHRVLVLFEKHTKSVRKGNLSKSACGKHSEIILKTFGK